MDWRNLVSGEAWNNNTQRNDIAINSSAIDWQQRERKHKEKESQHQRLRHSQQHHSSLSSSRRLGKQSTSISPRVHCEETSSDFELSLHSDTASMPRIRRMKEVCLDAASELHKYHGHEDNLNLFCFSKC